jgi:hypothetical protein
MKTINIISLFIINSFYAIRTESKLEYQFKDQNKVQIINEGLEQTKPKEYEYSKNSNNFDGRVNRMQNEDLDKYLKESSGQISRDHESENIKDFEPNNKVSEFATYLQERDSWLESIEKYLVNVLNTVYAWIYSFWSRLQPEEAPSFKKIIF